MIKKSARKHLQPQDKIYRLTLLEVIKKVNRIKVWKCRCECGNITAVYANSLTCGHTKSCGCLKIEKATETGRRCVAHGQAKVGKWTAEYRCWKNIKQRCCNPNLKYYKNYGGRGIKVCDRWVNSFENFYADMGKKPSSLYSIERIDVNGNYEPSNCRWATAKEQAANKRYHAYIPVTTNYIWDNYSFISPYISGIQAW